jgi:TctA family transporter
VFGYVLAKLGCEPAPLALGFVLGPMLEERLRTAMLLARGNPMTFIERPISAALLLIAAVMLVSVLMPKIRSGREEAFRE